MSISNPLRKTTVVLICLMIGVIVLLVQWKSTAEDAKASITSPDVPQIKIENPESGYPDGQMGYSIAIDGNTMIVGSPYTQVTRLGRAVGVARIYKRNDAGEWALQAELTAKDSRSNENFGHCVSISGNTAVVGVPYLGSASGLGDAPGSVYVFTRTGNVWTLQATLSVSNPSEAKNLGVAVSISGDTLAAGACEPAPLNSNGLPPPSRRGLVYVFTRNGAAWTQQTKLESPIDRDFGQSVSISGNTLLVGAIREGESIRPWEGIVYAFTRTDSRWNQQARLLPDDTTIHRFGISVSVSGDTAIIGSCSMRSPSTPPGSAYIFQRNESVWVQQQKLVPADGVVDDHFGETVSICGDAAAVGAKGNLGKRVSAVHVFARNGSTWIQQAKLTPSDPNSRNLFGNAISISGDIVAAGDTWGGGRVPHSGSAYIFSRKNMKWSQEQKLTGSLDTAAKDRFGNSVSISGDTAIIGAPEDNNAGGESGGAYVFTRNVSNWTLQQKLTPVDIEIGSYLGRTVAISGDTAAIGPLIRKCDTGLVFVFSRLNGVWTQQAKLSVPGIANEPILCLYVAISGDTIAAGTGSMHDLGGSVYVFVRNGSTWTLQAKLNSPHPDEEKVFGSTLSLSGDTLIVGVPGENGGIFGVKKKSGSAYVFTRRGSTWIQIQKLTASDASAGEMFGSSVSISGDTAAIGTRGKYKNDHSGAAYIFTCSNGVWTQQAKLTNSSASDEFGETVSISGDMVVVAAREYPYSWGKSGYIHAFTRTGSTWTRWPRLNAAQEMISSIAIDEKMAIVGIARDNDPEEESGSACVFDLRSLSR